jgi:hypothetical protein
MMLDRNCNTIDSFQHCSADDKRQVRFGGNNNLNGWIYLLIPGNGKIYAELL